MGLILEMDIPRKEKYTHYSISVLKVHTKDWQATAQEAGMSEHISTTQEAFYQN